MARLIDAPGVEIREIDKSGYSSTEDNSIVGTTSFLMGFADKGDDITPKYINTLQTFTNFYGYPKTEAERYFYNGAYEVLNRGGVLYTAKLPYDNNSYNKYSYTTYQVNDKLSVLSSTYDVVNSSFNDLFINTDELSAKLSDDQFYTPDHIKDFVDFTFEKLNIPYDTFDSIKHELTKTESETYKNSAVRLINIVNNIDDLTKYGELSNLKYPLTQYGGFEKLSSDFINSKPLHYFTKSAEYFLMDKISSDGLLSTISENCITIINNFNSHHYSDIKQVDNSLTSYSEISSTNESGMITMQNLDSFRTDQQKVGRNKIMFVDITREKYKKDPLNSEKEYIGIVPVITTAANAFYCQKLIENSSIIEKEYNAIKSLKNTKSSQISSYLSSIDNNMDEIVGFTRNFGGEESISENDNTISKDAASFFPSFKYVSGRIERNNLKKIGVVVYKMFIDNSNDSKISFIPVETFIGSLNRMDVDPNTGASTFIDRIINTNSNYINCFSNVQFNNTSSVRGLNDIEKSSLYLIHDQIATSLGFYDNDCAKTITVDTSITKSMDLIFDAIKDINGIDIDTIIDGGVSNIAQYIKSVYGGIKGEYNLLNENSKKFTCDSPESISVWKNILTKYDNFCKNVRKDCMFIADGMRPLCLIGQDEKIIRDTKPQNTISNTILKNLKYISGVLNTSYGAGYINWFRTVDAFSKDYFWCPPSIKAAGVYIYTDAYSRYWNAPAGLNRGVLPTDVIDVAFNPDETEAGVIYNNCWNYAVSYPIQGIVLEGQKTFQKDKTAFDRINVRRLSLGLKKNINSTSRYFNYENITSYYLSTFQDAIKNIMQDCQNKGGIKQYVVICDGRNNNDITIENNEVHCSIAFKPIKSGEFIVLNFICTNQSSDVNEIVAGNL